MATGFLIDDEELGRLLPEFIEIYSDRPIHDNSGGMDFNHSFATYCIAKKVSPQFIVESGVWKGHSTWLFEQACPLADIICIDPRPDFRQYTSNQASYRTEDFGMIDWSFVEPDQTLCFFDDHQNAYQRLMQLKWWGFSRAIFEDNFPCGEGDSYSLRHVFAGFGHPRQQMSAAYQPTDQENRLRAARADQVLHSIHDRQSIVRRPNKVDAAALEKNLEIYQEIRPVHRYDTNNWGGEWIDHYESLSPLFDELPNNELGLALEGIELSNPGKAFLYGYICFVELRV